MENVNIKGVTTNRDIFVQGVRKFILSVKYHGVGLTIIGVALNVLFLNKNRVLSDWYKGITSRRLDNRLGVDSAGCIPVDKLDIGEERKLQALWYQPIASITFGLVLSNLKINYEDYIFIDYGSGKGRALFLAAYFSFKRIIGVELSNELHKICLNNIRNFHDRKVKRSDITSVCEDATNFDLPKEPSVIFFFQPFNREIFTVVMDIIRRSLQKRFRHIIIVYYHPGFENHIGEPDFLRKVDYGISSPGWDFYETATEDRFSLRC
jgi:SAM-dependent methyltransferase